MEEDDPERNSGRGLLRESHALLVAPLLVLGAAIPLIFPAFAAAAADSIADSIADLAAMAARKATEEILLGWSSSLSYLPTTTTSGSSTPIASATPSTTSPSPATPDSSTASPSHFQSSVVPRSPPTLVFPRIKSVTFTPPSITLVLSPARGLPWGPISALTPP
ncbi:unnamed protein product [Spirodela intermedia]|uniref:Uncharacterized protein n=1 Tax=Spirodela intermedia TaxID=51605 RepID=A0A7I8JY34_SPIIN|nr:unnamed protein product [Spirodela intermedia]